MKRTMSTAVLAATLLVGAVACSTSGDDASATTTTTTTKVAPSTTTAPDETTTTAAATTTAVATTTTAAVTPEALPPCQDLLQEYADVFTPDDLSGASAFFRKYAPLMPDAVGAASLRIADAYDAVDGDISKLDFGDADLNADAEAFSNWTNEGCPPS